MLISMLPADNDNTASSRIRCYTLHNILVKNHIDAQIGYIETADILYIQKKLTHEILYKAKCTADSGRTVIYDVDDLNKSLYYWASPDLVTQIMKLADLVTTDTEGHRLYIEAVYKPRCTAVIPDSIDYYPIMPAKLILKEACPLRILWFGSMSNISLFEKYASTLASLSDAEVVIATGVEGLAQCKSVFPYVTFVPWSRESFITTLQSCHLTCLMHDGSDIDMMKSNNKMIASIAWGIPAVVSSTPEYARTAHEAGIDYAVFKDHTDLPGIIEMLRDPAVRKNYLKSSQSIIWSLYSPQSVAMQFLSSIKKLISEKPKKLVCANTATLVQETPTACQHSNPALERDYLRDWVRPEGKSYRLGVYDRQRKGGAKPLISNPTIDEIRTALYANNANTVMEIGCGWGRIMEELVDEFHIEGCDVSQDMLNLCPQHLNVFYHDITVEDMPFLRANQNRWDVIFTRGVMLYFVEVPVQMAYAMNNMLMLASKKIIIWEWQDVCDRMKQFSDNPKFEYYPIERRSE